MRKIVIGSIPLVLTALHATNGDLMIALGAKSTAMGGTGIAKSYGSESALNNPALIEGTEVSFAGTVFMPDVAFKNTIDGFSNSYMKSTADLNLIPEVAISYEVNENFTWGLGMFGVAGMGVDYRDDTVLYAVAGDGSTYQGTQSGTNQMLTSLQIMKFALPLAYKHEGLAIGVAPVLQYGALSIGYNNGAYFVTPGGNVNVMTSNGVSQDLGFGYEVGVAFDFAKVGLNGATLGVIYKSPIDMTYENQISSATKNFGINGGAGFSDHLEQPAEIGVGVAYNVRGNTISVDFKQVAWDWAKGYKDFGWTRQNVIAVGYEYATALWAIRMGYNYGNNPIEEQSAADMTVGGDYDGAVINYFNLAGFPAIIEQHYTIGGGYHFNNTTSVDIAVVYSPEETKSYDTSAMTQVQAADPLLQSEASVKHSQMAVTFGMNYRF